MAIGSARWIHFSFTKISQMRAAYTRRSSHGIGPRPLVIEYYSAFPRMQIGPTAVGIPDRNNLQNARLRGGAGRTRTNHQSVMEHGWCPTNSPGRTPIQIAGSFAVLLDFPGILILDQPPEGYGTWFESDQLPWSDTHPDRRRLLFSVIILAV